MSEQPKNKNTKLIQSLISEAKHITYENGQRDAVIKRSQMLLRRFIGTDTYYVNSLNAIRFNLSITSSHTTVSDRIRAFENGKKQLLNLLNVIEEELELNNESFVDNSNDKVVLTKKIFIVHGHNIAIQQTVARTIETLGLLPIS